MPFVIWDPPDWLSEPIAVCEEHGDPVRWRCRTCRKNLCRQCMVDPEPGVMACQGCGSVIVRPKREIPLPSNVIKFPTRTAASERPMRGDVMADQTAAAKRRSRRKGPAPTQPGLPGGYSDQ